MITVSRKAKSLVVPDTTGVRNLFPNALPYGNNLIVPHGMYETLTLRHLGYSVPNPMLTHYDWGPCTPYLVQRKTCAHLTENPRFYNCNHMGTGKTKTALWAWDYLNRAGLAKKLLVVAPKSTIYFVWQREAFETLPERKVQVLHGSKQIRLDRLAQNADIYIINHHGIEIIEDELSARTDIDTLVLDELAVYRNNSDRSKTMRVFANRFPIVWGMTGEPTPRGPLDVWAQCKIITPHRVPKYRNEARGIMETHVGGFKWVPKPDAVKTAHEWMQPACRYTLDEVVELPETIYRHVDVDMSDDQKIAYKKMANALAAMVQQKEITAVNAGVAMGKLLQIAGGWIYTDNPNYVRVDPSPRIEALRDLINSCDQKVLVAVPYRHMIEGLNQLFVKAKMDHCMVHGDTKDKEDLFYLFQHTDKYKVMLVHPECTKHGLTLTAATMIIWYLPVPSLEVYNQFNHRIIRIGQKHKQQILHIEATPNEKKIYKMLEGYEKLQDSFLKMKEQQSFSYSLLDMLSTT